MLKKYLQVFLILMCGFFFLGKESFAQTEFVPPNITWPKEKEIKTDSGRIIPIVEDKQLQQKIEPIVKDIISVLGPKHQKYEFKLYITDEKQPNAGGTRH